MRKEYRLPGRGKFHTVYNQGSPLANRLLAARVLSNDLPYNRYAFAVGRRLGGAVVRNRLRRRLKEAMGTMRLSGGWDIIVVARRPALEASFAQLQEGLADIHRRIVRRAAQMVREGDENTER